MGSIENKKAGDSPAQCSPVASMGSIENKKAGDSPAFLFATGER